MFKNSLLQPALWLTACSLLSACGSGGSEGEPTPNQPQLSVVNNLTVKEKRSNTVTATGPAGTYSWTQLSGPQLQLSGQNSAALTLTAPAVDADSTAVLQISLTTADNKAVSQQVTVAIKNNLPPQLSANFAPVREKTTAQLKVQASDTDGQISAIRWVQNKGQPLSLSGTTTDTISFTVPALSANSQVSFLITATDDDGDSHSIEQTLQLQQLLQTFELKGQLTDKAMAGASLTASTAGQQFSAVADNNGQYSLTITADDDESNLLTLVTAAKAGQPALSYHALVPDLAIPSASQPLQLNALSTAWYAALLSANQDKAPANLAELAVTEAKTDVSRLLDKAAVASLLVQGQAQLPADAGNLLKVLTHQPSYTEVSNALWEMLPPQKALLLADATQLPALSQQQLTQQPLLTQEPIMPGFVQYGGKQFSFSEAGQGTMLWMYNSASFDWSLLPAKIQLDWRDFSNALVLDIDDDRLGLTADEIYHLRSRNRTLVEATQTYQQSLLQPLISAHSIDVFSLEDHYQVLMKPIVFSSSNMTIAPPAQAVVDQRVSLVSKKSPSQLTFTPAELNGEWAMYRYLPKEIYDYADVYLDPLVFHPNGTGVSQNSAQQFNWQLDAKGALHVLFADGSALQVRKITAHGSHFGVHTTHFSADGKRKGGFLSEAFAVDQQKASQLSVVNSANSYWQRMDYLSSPTRWTGTKLPIAVQSSGSYVTKNVEGFQFFANGTATSITGDLSKPKPYASYFKQRWQTVINDQGQSVIRAEWTNYCEDDPKAICQIREWRLLASTDGVLGKRLYVEEINWERFMSTDPMEHLLGPRLTVYEEVSFDYFSSTP